MAVGKKEIGIKAKPIKGTGQRADSRPARFKKEAERPGAIAGKARPTTAGNP